MNWAECRISKFQVIKDFLYIFFRLKYFPDNYSICRLWEKPRKEWIYYYGSVYDAWQRWRLRKKVFPLKYRLIYDDKHLCYLLCKANDLPLPISHGVVTPDDFKERVAGILNLNPEKALIVKPLEGRGGKGIVYIIKNQGKIQFKEQGDKLYESFRLSTESVIQEYIEQHKDLSVLSNSVNTIRIVTMMTKDQEVIYLGARMRIGVGQAFLDNTSQGGMAINIDMSEGTFEQIARDNKGQGYLVHPTSGITLKGFKIPFWKEVLELAAKVQMCLPYNKLLGQDIAISSDGPVIIELNAEYDNVMFEQVCGPILKNDKVREEFKRYGLLINRYQKKL